MNFLVFGPFMILQIGDPFYSPSELSNNVRTMYLDYMVDVAVLFGANVHKAKTDSIEVLNLLLKLSQVNTKNLEYTNIISYTPTRGPTYNRTNCFRIDLLHLCTSC